MIFGCGTLTDLLVPYLRQAGHLVTVLTDDADALERLRKEYQVQGVYITEPLMQDYLQEGDIEITEVFLAISDSDHQNALVAQIAKHIFNVGTVICRLENPQLQQLYAGLGLKVIGTSTSGLYQETRQLIEG
jgi:Trk K+ transport system NAD-binding subunit